MLFDIEKSTLFHVSSGLSSNWSTDGRRRDALLIRLAGEAVYHFPDRDIVTKPGDLLLRPREIPYVFQVNPDTPCSHLAISFANETAVFRPQVFSLESFSDKNDLYNHFFDWWTFGGCAEKCKCLSIFYNLLSHISRLDTPDYSSKSRFSIISPAEEYLKRHIFDVSLKAEHLHGLCRISAPYFRSIFRDKYGTSPQDYIINTRLNHSKLLIENEDFLSVSSLALSVGYSDPLYFSRAFKRKFGFCPTSAHN